MPRTKCPQAIQAAKWLNEQFITIGTQVTIMSYDDEDGDGDPVD